MWTNAIVILAILIAVPLAVLRSLGKPRSSRIWEWEPDRDYIDTTVRRITLRRWNRGRR